MSYYGDIRLGDTIDIKFTTVNTSGVPTQLAGTPAVSAYIDNSTTEITAGITLTVDFDTRTGLNNVRVVATSGNGYTTGTNVQLVITTGTVSGGSVVGYVIGSFSIEKREANVTRVGGTTQTAGDIIGDTNDIQSRLPASLVSGRIDANVGTISTGAITATSIATDAIDADALAADALDEFKARVDISLSDVNLDHLVGTATGIPSIPAGTYLDQIMDDGTATFDRTTDSLQAIKDSAVTPGQVNAEVLDVLNVDAFGEPGQEAPGVSVSLVKKIGYLYKAFRNKITQTSTTLSIYADDTTTVDQKTTVSDDGSTFTRNELGTGP